MGWVELPKTADDDKAWRTARKTRFLVDENLGPEVTELLRSWDPSVTDVFEEGLVGRSDEDVFAFAWREKRVLLTHDDDFLDDARFPEHRSPGVVILRGAGGNSANLAYALGMVRAFMERMPEVWRGDKITIHGDEMIVRTRDFDSGARKTIRFKLPSRGPLLMWVEEDKA